MAFNIQNFASEIKRNGTLQTNRFEVRISRPRAFLRGGPIEENNQFLWNTIRLRAEQINLPGFDAATYDNRRYGVGPTFKVATGVQAKETTMSFIETGKNDIFKLFYDWTNLIVDYESYRNSSNISVPTIFATGYKEDIIAETIEIRVYNNTGVGSGPNIPTPGGLSLPVANTVQQPLPIARVYLVDAFPISVADTSLSWNDNNTLLKVNVTFAFSSWYMSPR